MFKPESEFGGEAEDREEGLEVEEKIEKVEGEIDETVALTDTDRHMLAEIFDKARASYDTLPGDWDLLFENLTTGLQGADPEDFSDILDQYRIKAKNLAQ